MSVIDTILIVLACVFFFIAGIAPHINNPPTPINWLAWGLFCFALAALPFF
jgi:hypothetical protein